MRSLSECMQRTAGMINLVYRKFFEFSKIALAFWAWIEYNKHVECDDGWNSCNARVWTLSGPEGSSNKHCIVCAVGIFCPEHSTIAHGQRRRKSALFFTFFYLTAEGRRIQRELHFSHIKKLHTYHMYVTKARKMSKNRTLSKFREGVKREKGWNVG